MIHAFRGYHHWMEFMDPLHSSFLIHTPLCCKKIDISLLGVCILFSLALPLTRTLTICQALVLRLLCSVSFNLHVNGKAAALIAHIFQMRRKGSREVIFLQSGKRCRHVPSEQLCALGSPCLHPLCLGLLQLHDSSVTQYSPNMLQKSAYLRYSPCIYNAFL